MVMVMCMSDLLNMYKHFTWKWSWSYSWNVIVTNSKPLIHISQQMKEKGLNTCFENTEYRLWRKHLFLQIIFHLCNYDCCNCFFFLIGFLNYKIYVVSLFHWSAKMVSILPPISSSSISFCLLSHFLTCTSSSSLLVYKRPKGRFK